MLVNDAIDFALARCAELGTPASGPKSGMILRVSQYQQRLFAMASEWNPDYFGVCVVGTLNLGVLDLSDIIAPLEAIERITRIEVANPGISPFLAKQTVNVVPLNDPDVEIPPRATIRRRVLKTVGTDLTDVASVRVHYSPVPAAIPATTGGTTALDLPAPHDGLVPLDLVLYLLDRIPSPDNAVAQGRAGVVAEQAMAMTAFEDHVRGFASMSTRFDEYEGFEAGEK
ncbi:MAG: hypothetical protein ABJA80_04000 [bacterium]